MKKLLILIIILISGIIHAQKIRVKKGEILLDKQKIGSIEKVDNQTFLISDKNHSSYLIEYFKGDRLIYLNIKDEKTGKNNDIEFPDYIALFLRRSLAETLFNQEFLTPDGFDEKKINALLEGPDAQLYLKASSEKHPLTKQEILKHSKKHLIVFRNNFKRPKGIRVSVSMGETLKLYRRYLRKENEEIIYFPTTVDMLNYFDELGFDLISSNAIDHIQRYVFKRKKENQD